MQKMGIYFFDEKAMLLGCYTLLLISKSASQYPRINRLQHPKSHWRPTHGHPMPSLVTKHKVSVLSDDNWLMRGEMLFLDG